MHELAHCVQICLAAASHELLCVVEQALCCWHRLAAASLQLGHNVGPACQGLKALITRCAPQADLSDLDALDDFRREVKVPERIS